MSKKNKLNEEDFVVITNKDIYTELKNFRCEYDNGHKAVLARQDITNGKVKLANWIATTALTLTLMVIGWLILGKI